MENLNEEITHLVTEYETIIVNRLINKIGEENIVSIILTGSIARNKINHKIIDGKLYIENDFDVVVVVNPSVIVKSLILIKRIASKLTAELKNRNLLSGVSISISTETALSNSNPTIFYQDLSRNGKTIFGKNICKDFNIYNVDRIPPYDIYRLIFNRMIESLEVYVSSGFLEKRITNTSIHTLLISIEKLTFALIQALLIKNNILIFRGHDLNELQKSNDIFGKFLILDELLSTYTKIKNDEKMNITEIMLQSHWNKAIEHVNSTIEILAQCDEVRPLQIKRLILGHEKINKRLKFSIILFLQYFSISKTSDLIRTAIYRVLFGSDYTYIPLYFLFLNTEFTHMKKIRDSNIYHDLEFTLGKFNCSSIESWSKSFEKWFAVWKLMNS